MSRAVALAVLLLLTCAAIFAAYLAFADFEFRKSTPESVAHAAEIRPSNTRYLALRALQLDYDGSDPVPVLERIAVLNPVSSAPRIRLGLAAEVRGDFVTAEHWLLSAARVDQQFEPSWTLANFYFRQNRAEDFWTWIRRALEVSYGDRTPAFELCWRMAGEPNEVLERAMPDRPEVASAYLYYLLDRHRTDRPKLTGNYVVEDASLRLARSVVAYDAAAVEAICDFLIDERRAESARELWAMLGNPNLTGMTNGDFGHPSRGRGFDWRFEGGSGVVHVPQDGGGHRVVLSGKEAERTALLRQFVYLEPGKRYTLRWKIRTSGIAMLTGLSWTASTDAGIVDASGEWRDGKMEFTATSVLTQVELVYQRPAGLARAEGRIDVASVSLAPLSRDGATSSAK